jgi:hypothetical protein
VELESEVEGAADIPQDPLDEVQVRFPRSVHVETRLLNSMSDVRTCKRQVLKSPCKALVLGGIGDERTIVGG